MSSVNARDCQKCRPILAGRPGRPDLPIEAQSGSRVILRQGCVAASVVRAHQPVVPDVAWPTASAVTSSSRGAAQLSECQAVQASKAASGSSAKQAMASASAYGNCGAADIVSNHASMHKIAVVAAAAGLVARCWRRISCATLSRHTASRTSRPSQEAAKLRSPACPCSCSTSTPIHGTSRTPQIVNTLASTRDPRSTNPIPY